MTMRRCISILLQSRKFYNPVVILSEAKNLAGLRWKSFAALKIKIYSGARHGGILEQADLQVAGLIDNFAVRRDRAVGDPEHQLRTRDPLKIDRIDQFFH